MWHLKKTLRSIQSPQAKPTSTAKGRDGSLYSKSAPLDILKRVSSCSSWDDYVTRRWKDFAGLKTAANLQDEALPTPVTELTWSSIFQGRARSQEGPNDPAINALCIFNIKSVMVAYLSLSNKTPKETRKQNRQNIIKTVLKESLGTLGISTR